MVSSQNYVSGSADQARAALMAELENPTEWVTDEAGLSTAEAAKLVNAFEVAVKTKVRAQIAADFESYGKQHGSLSWGQAFYIARDGLGGAA